MTLNPLIIPAKLDLTPIQADIQRLKDMLGSLAAGVRIPISAGGVTGSAQSSGTYNNVAGPAAASVSSSVGIAQTVEGSYNTVAGPARRRRQRVDDAELSPMLRSAQYDYPAFSSHDMPRRRPESAASGSGEVRAARQEIESLRAASANPIIVRVRYETDGGGARLANPLARYGAMSPFSGGGDLSSAMLLGGGNGSNGRGGGGGGGGGGQNWDFEGEVVSPQRMLGGPGGAGGGGAGGGGGGGLGAPGMNYGAWGNRMIPPRGRGGLGYVRPVVAAYFAARMINRVITENDHNRETNRIMATGTIDEQLANAQQRAQEADQGLSGLASRNPLLVGGLIGVAGNIIRGSSSRGLGYANTETIRDEVEGAVRARRAQLSSQDIGLQIAGLRRDTQQYSATPFRQEVNSAYGAHEERMIQVRAYRQQAFSAGPQEANRLTSDANKLEAASKDLRSAAVANAISSHFILPAITRTVDTLRFGMEGITEIAAAGMEARGNQYGAFRARAVSAYALEEMSESNPVMRFMMRGVHRALLGAADRGHARELQEATEDLGVQTTLLQSQMPGADSVGLRQQALRKEKDLALARYRNANPNDLVGYAALESNFNQQLALQEATASQSRQIQQIGLRGAIQSGAQRLAGRPLDAQITELQAQMGQEITASGGGFFLPGGMINPVAVIGMNRIRQAKQDAAFNRQLTGLSLTSENTQLQMLLQDTPNVLGAQSVGIRDQSIVRAMQLQHDQMPAEARMALQNGVLQQRALQRDYLDSFRAVEVEKSFVVPPRDQESPEEAMKAINQSIIDLKDAIRALGPVQ